MQIFMTVATETFIEKSRGETNIVLHDSFLLKYSALIVIWRVLLGETI